MEFHKNHVYPKVFPYKPMIPNKCEGPVMATPRMAQFHDARRVNFLIPVDSTAGAYNSLAYALKLARACNARIHLVHLTDLNELSESSNPFVISRMLSTIERKARNCVTALRELIEDSGIEVLSHNAMIGNIDALLFKQIECVTPDLVIIGRDNFRKATITRMLRTSSSPTLVVPASAEPDLPENIALYTGQARLPERSFNPLLRIVRSTTCEFSIIDVAAGKDRKSPINDLHSKSGDLRIHHRLLSDGRSTESIRSFVDMSGIDLLCTSYGYASPLHRILGQSYTTTLVYSLNMPIMVMRPAPKVAL